MDEIAGIRASNIFAREKGRFKGEKDRAVGERDRLYKSKAWRATRKRVLMANPICVNCGKLATVVDHILGHAMPNWRKLFWDYSNLQPMCKNCHDEKTMTERPTHE